MCTDLLLINKFLNINSLIRPKALLLAFGFIAVNCISQVNYVQNPSFEDGPCSAVNFEPIPPYFWDTLRAGGGGGPEYCTECETWPFNTVPKNSYLSFQIPKSGKRYCYYTNYNSMPSTGENREYIQNELIKNLKPNKNYCVTFYVSLMNESKYAITEYGAYFDDGSIKTSYYGSSTLTPQVKSPVGVFLTDTLNWTKVQGTFTANGNEKFLTLGSFKDNATISFSIMPPLPVVGQRKVADYYIDDVSVIEADLPAYAGRDTVLCTGDSVFIGRPPEIGLECLWYNNGSQIATGGGLWVKPATSQTYMVSQDICGLIKKDTIHVQIKPKYTGATINIAASTATTCPNNTITLTVNNNPPVTGTYNWLPLGVYTQTGSGGAKAQIPQTTTFTLNLNNNGQNAFCPFQQTSSVTVAVPLYTSTPIITSNINLICPSDTILLKLPVVPGNSVTYTWLPSLAFTFTNNVIAKSVINQTTTYTLNISSSGNNSLCPFTSKINTTINVADTCFKDPQIPNIFTPNNDDVNDVWQVKFPIGYKLNTLNIYNRWGTLIYERNSLLFNINNLTPIGWDGRTTSGEECAAGVYFYVLNYTDKYDNAKVAKGNITLMK